MAFRASWSWQRSRGLLWLAEQRKRESRKEAQPPGVPESGEEGRVTEGVSRAGQRGSRVGGRKRQKCMDRPAGAPGE